MTDKPLSPEIEAEIARAMRRYERRERRERHAEKFDAGLGSWLTIGEEFGQ